MNFTRNTKPDAIIHSAAFTGVNGYENEQDKIFRVNGIGTRNVAIAARAADAGLFYISTNYVFDGVEGMPYLELDKPNPIDDQS